MKNTLLWIFTLFVICLCCEVLADSATSSLEKRISEAEALFDVQQSESLKLANMLHLEVENLDDYHQHARVDILLARLYSIYGDSNLAKKYAEKAVNYEKLTNKQKAYIYNVLSYIPFSTNDFDKAKELAQQAYDFSQQTQDEMLQLEMLINRTLVYAYAGDLEQALSDVLEAYANIDKVTSAQKKADLLDTVSQVYAVAGDNQKSLDYALRALEVIKTTPNKQQISAFEMGAAASYRLLEEWDKAVEHYQNSYQLATEISDEFGKIYALWGMGKAQSKLGNHESAVNRLQEVVNFMDQQDDPATHFYTRWDLGIAARDGGKLELAVEVLEQARTIAKQNEQAMQFEYTSATGSLARALNKQGKHKQAFEYLHEFVKERNKQIKVEDVASYNEVHVTLNTELTTLENQLLEKQNAIKQALLLQEQKTTHRYIMFILVAVALLLSLLLLLKRNMEMRKKLHLLSITDELTQISNRRHIMQIYDKEFYRAKRYKVPLCIALFDIDHFKNLNDQYGHAVGDRVLKQVAQSCDLATRQQDYLGRYGGEEFMLVFPHSQYSDTREVCDRLRIAISELKFGDCYPGNITISIGLAERTATDEKPFETLQRADEALYQAKLSGRNRVCTA